MGHEGPMHTTGADLAASSLCEFHPVLDHVVFLGNSDTKKSRTEVSGLVSGGWHCDDLCNPPCSCSPLLALVPGARCSSQQTSCLAWDGLASLGPLPLPSPFPQHQCFLLSLCT